MESLHVIEGATENQTFGEITWHMRQMQMSRPSTNGAISTNAAYAQCGVRVVREKLQKKEMWCASYLKAFFGPVGFNLLGLCQDEITELRELAQSNH